MYVYIIPCGGEKTATAAPARDLYTGSAFRHALATAEALVADHAAEGEEARVLIMSALHGLVALDTVLDPYDVKMGPKTGITVEALTASAEAAGIAYGDEVYAMLPGSARTPYFPRLAAALDALDVFPQDVYEAAPGIGYQRGVCSTANRTLADENLRAIAADNAAWVAEYDARCAAALAPAGQMALFA